MKLQKRKEKKTPNVLSLKRKKEATEEKRSENEGITIR